MLHVAAFALCGYAGTLERTAKPFNPLLGETYEWRSADGSCRFLSEQVSTAAAHLWVTHPAAFGWTRNAVAWKHVPA